jgi:enolase
MSAIKAIKAREILDSQGMPTLQILLWIEDGRSVIVTVPNEWGYNNQLAQVIRDHDDQEFNGFGVKKAVANVNQTIAPQLLGSSVLQQGEIDKKLLMLDHTQDKSFLGANSILGVSMAVAKAGALSVGLPLYQYIQKKYQLTEYASIPNCIYGLINGGDFGNDNLDFQEFELIPASHVSFERSITMASTLKQKIKNIIETKGGSVCSGPIGGFLPRMNKNADVYELILEAIKDSQYTFAQDIFFGLDAAADGLATDGHYQLRDKQDKYSSKDLLDFYKTLREKYKTIYLEDPFSDSDKKHWQKITEDLGATTRIVGDEFLKGSLEKTQQAVQEKTCNAIGIKLLDRGTISETMQLIKVAKDAEWSVIVSEHSGETNETFIVDLAVGVGADYVKFGPPNRGERVAKYNRLIEINEEIQPE